MKENLLYVEKIHVDYKVFTLSVENLSINPGITLLIGPNGAGKTTFMESLLGLRKEATVLCTYDQERIKYPLDVRIKERLSFMPEALTLNGYKKVKFYSKFYKVLYGSFDEDLFYSTLEKFQISSDRKIGELSAGQKRMFYFSLNLRINNSYETS